MLSLLCCLSVLFHSLCYQSIRQHFRLFPSAVQSQPLTDGPELDEE